MICHTGLKHWLVWIIISIAAVIFVTAIIWSAITYHNSKVLPSTMCTEYEALTTETILCGEGDSCSSGGVNISVGGKYSANQPIKSWLVPRSELTFHSRHRSLIQFGGVLTSSLLFSSSPVKFYSWRETVVSGNCCITNSGSTMANVVLNIFPSYHSALNPSQEDAIFRENISIGRESTKCFDNWGPGKPFVAESDSYFFFSLFTSTGVNYNIEMVTKQVYVNGTQYREPVYFASSNYSTLVYGKCFKNSGLHKKPKDYVILCQANFEDVENDSLQILSCPLRLTSFYERLWLSLMIVFLILAILLLAITAFICSKGRPWKKTKWPTQESVRENS